MRMASSTPSTGQKEKEVASRFGRGDARMPFLAHLEELRRRVMRATIAIGIAFAVCYYFSSPILRFFLKPIRENLNQMGGGEIVFRQITEPFLIYMKVAFLAALFLAAPYVFF